MGLLPSGEGCGANADAAPWGAPPSERGAGRNRAPLNRGERFAIRGEWGEVEADVPDGEGDV